MSPMMSENDFLSYVISDLIKNGINVKLYNKDNLHGYDGFYNAEKKTLEVACQKPSFMETLLHEYGHFLQHSQRPKFYEKYGHSKFIQWLFGYHDKASKKEVESWVKDCIILEQDCEKIVSKLITNLKLPFDLEEYCASSNAYLISFWYALEFKKMPKSLGVIVDYMPIKIKNLGFYLNQKNYFKVRSVFLENE
jgi:hypothetical protein